MSSCIVQTNAKSGYGHCFRWYSVFVKVLPVLPSGRSNKWQFYVRFSFSLLNSGICFEGIHSCSNWFSIPWRTCNQYDNISWCKNSTLALGYLSILKSTLRSDRLLASCPKLVAFTIILHSVAKPLAFHFEGSIFCCACTSTLLIRSINNMGEYLIPCYYWLHIQEEEKSRTELIILFLYVECLDTTIWLSWSALLLFSAIQALISSWKKGDTMPFIYDTVNVELLLKKYQSQTTAFIIYFLASENTSSLHFLRCGTW